MTKVDYRNETIDLLRRLLAAKFEIRWTDNGEGVFSWNPNLLDAEGIDQEFVEETMACDVATLGLAAPDGKKVKVFLVYGNSAGELVCDYTVHPDLEAVADAFSAAHEAC